MNQTSYEMNLKKGEKCKLNFSPVNHQMSILEIKELISIACCYNAAFEVPIGSSQFIVTCNTVDDMISIAEMITEYYI